MLADVRALDLQMQNLRGKCGKAHIRARADPAGRLGGGQLVGPRQTLPTPKLGFLLGFRPLYFGNAQK